MDNFKQNSTHKLNYGTDFDITKVPYKEMVKDPYPFIEEFIEAGVIVEGEDYENR